VELLCHVKAHGTAGAAKRLAAHIAARVTGVTRDAFETMERAAIEDGALVVDEGEWVITGWSDRQVDPTAAERMRRYRERLQALTEEPAKAVTRNDRNVTAVTPTETKTETKTTTSVHKRTELEFPVKPKQSSGQYEYPEPFERAWAAYPSRDGSNPKVGAYSAFRSRVASGAVPDQLVIAAEHYCQHCQSREIEGTSFVQQASTFWGPSEPWREFVQAPVAKRANGAKWVEMPGSTGRIEL
jgi:hypothetical protein